MSLIRRCDGCGNDIEPDYTKGPIANYVTVKLPAPKSGYHEFNFHSVDCVVVWIQREDR